MRAEVHLFPFAEDNYLPLIEVEGEALLVDPGEALVAQKALLQRGLKLGGILVTHHHHDHIGGVEELVADWACPVRWPSQKEDFHWRGLRFEVQALPGHTLDHVVYFERRQGWLFCGDVLFGLGCGRLFEGSFEQAYSSLQWIKSLPDEVLVYCAHEYTAANLRFRKGLGPLDEELTAFAQELTLKRVQGLPSVPLNLGFEKRQNPFLTAQSLDEFRQLRLARNSV